MPKKVIDIENLSDSTENESESEPERLTKPIKKADKPKKVLSDKQKAVLEGARKKRMENIETAKKNKKLEAAKLLIENETNLKIKDKEVVQEKPKRSKTKTIIIESESESSSSSEEQIVIKKKKGKKPKQIIKEESEEESEEEVIKKPKQRQLKPQISTQKLNKLNVFDGFV